ncbi:MAG: hypothetical protein ACRDQW_02780 [Haloechinothrix sp.]
MMIGLALILVVRFAPQGVIPERLRKRGVLAFSGLGCSARPAREGATA